MTDVTDTTGCQCGCNVTTDVTNASEPCGCGCACCAETPKTAEQATEELRTLRDRIDRRLAELDKS